MRRDQLSPDPSGLLLGELEVEAACEQEADQVAHRRALFMGAAHQLRVHVDGDADQPFLHVGHLREDITGGMLCAKRNRSGAALTARSTAQEDKS